jgi:hypothetical protein
MDNKLINSMMSCLLFKKQHNFIKILQPDDECSLSKYIFMSRVLGDNEEAHSIHSLGLRNLKHKLCFNFFSTALRQDTSE